MPLTPMEFVVGAGLAFLLLLFLATLGMFVGGGIILSRRADSKPAPNPLLLLGFLQGWLAYLWCIFADTPLHVIEWIWLASMAGVAISFVLVFKKRPMKPPK